ncbi:MAG: hypothetical protein AB7O24_06015 [Kofleriaceae bacterium]
MALSVLARRATRNCLAASAAFTVLVAIGCAKPPPPGAELVTKNQDLAERMCACKDQSCVAPLRSEWEALNKDSSGSFTSDQVQALAEATKRFEACAAAIAK